MKNNGISAHREIVSKASSISSDVDRLRVQPVEPLQLVQPQATGRATAQAPPAAVIALAKKAGKSEVTLGEGVGEGGIDAQAVARKRGRPKKEDGQRKTYVPTGRPRGRPRKEDEAV